MFRFTEAQAMQTLELIRTLRPDWNQSEVNSSLYAANHLGLPHAADYGHLIRALAQYATQPDSHGRPFGRDWDGFLRAGAHWTGTAPAGFTPPRGARCREHPDFHEPCPCCRADRIAERPPDVEPQAPMHGTIAKHHTPERPATGGAR